MRRSCPIYWAASFVIARLPKAAEAISWRGMRLPRTFQVLACMKTLRFVKGVDLSSYFLLLSFLIRHSSLEPISLDACIRPFQGMSIFPEVSHSMNEHRISHASLAHTSLVTEGLFDSIGSW